MLFSRRGFRYVDFELKIIAVRRGRRLENLRATKRISRGCTKLLQITEFVNGRRGEGGGRYRLILVLSDQFLTSLDETKNESGSIVGFYALTKGAVRISRIYS